MTAHEPAAHARGEGRVQGSRKRRTATAPGLDTLGRSSCLRPARHIVQRCGLAGTIPAPTGRRNPATPWRHGLRPNAADFARNLSCGTVVELSRCDAISSTSATSEKSPEPRGRVPRFPVNDWGVPSVGAVKNPACCSQRPSHSNATSRVVAVGCHERPFESWVHSAKAELRSRDLPSWLVKRRSRKLDGEDAPGARHVPDGQNASISLHASARDGKTESQPALVLTGLNKGLEDA